jgi:hypothetical protein
MCEDVRSGREAAMKGVRREDAGKDLLNMRSLTSMMSLLLAALVSVGVAHAGAPEMSVDRPGHDYVSFELDEDFPACQMACEGESRCKAWTWVVPGVQGSTARCWLKDVVPAPVGGASYAVSGVKDMAVTPLPPTQPPLPPEMPQVPPPAVCEHGDPCAN